MTGFVAGRARPRWLTALVGATTLLVLAALLVACSPPESVALEAKGDPGSDAFTESVAGVAPDAFPETVVAQLAEVSTQFEGEGIRVAPALTPGLYGETPGAVPCDVDALATAITADESPAKAWGDVFGMPTDDIPDFLGTLTPVVLTTDTLVTNHGYASGRAVPRSAVLEAGTAVLIDPRGVPAVRCACGNPLLPARDGIQLSETTGTAWTGYSADSVITVAPGAAAATSFTVTDLSTGALVDRRAGSNVGELLILTAGVAEGAVYVSRDGADWSQVLSSPLPLNDVAAADDLAVAVGGAFGTGGVVYTSTGGTEWGDAVTVADPLTAVAHGDDQWLAGGTDATGNAVVYGSADGATWEPVGGAQPTDADRLAPESIAYGSGTWAMTALECQYRVCHRSLLTSTDDGVTWADQSLSETVFDLRIAYDGATWGALGAERNPDEGFIDMASLGHASLGIGATSSDPATWEFAPTTPGRVWLTALAPGLSDWLALDITPFGSSPPPAQNGIHRSTDVTNWTRVGTTPSYATAVAALRSFAADVAAPAGASGPRDGAVVTLGTTGIDVSAGSDSATLAYTSLAADAVSTLTEYLGAGAAGTLPAGQCVSEGTTTTSWGWLTLVDRPDASWYVTVESTLPPDVDVRVPGGLALPVSGDDLVAADPGNLEFADAASGYEQYLLDPADGKGVQIVLYDGKLSVTAPAFADDGVGHGCKI